MSFLSPVFFVFISVFLTVYFAVPQKYKYIVIALGSWFFYGYANPKVLVVLFIATLISYVGGWVIHSTGCSRVSYAAFFLLEISVLVFFKYLDFLVDNLNLILLKISKSVTVQTKPDLLMPIGLSFIVFQACTYLSDIYRKKINVVKNPIQYSAFVAFFLQCYPGRSKRHAFCFRRFPNRPALISIRRKREYFSLHGGYLKRSWWQTAW